MTPLTAISSLRHTVSGLNLLEQIILLVLVTVGIVCTTWDGMIFEKPAEWVKSKIGEWWAKPLFACYICATFWYSLLQCWLYDWPLLLAIPAMGLSAVISLFQND